jgi:hypothetical protein
MSEKSDSKSEKLPVNDHVLIAAEAALSLLPGGSILALLLDKYVPTTLQARRDELLATLRDDLERLKRRISDERLRSQTFHVMLVRVLRDSVGESAKEKQAAFRAILLNDAVSPSENPESGLFIKITEDLTAEHIQTLQVLHDPENISQKQPRVADAVRAPMSTNVMRPMSTDLVSLLLQPALPHIPSDHWKVLLTGLASYGLIENMGEAWTGWTQPLDPRQALKKRTTPLGDRYLDSITFLE